MHALELKSAQFSGYPPEAKRLAIQYIEVLQRLPVSFLPSLLRELVEYDYKFPAERSALESELANLSSLSAEQSNDWFRAFAQIQLSPQLEKSDWINSPGQFVEQLSSHLWITHQLDAFRAAATQYAERLRVAVPPEKPPIPRLGIAVIGQGAEKAEEPLFRKLRPHGAYFSGINPENGLSMLLDAVAARAKKHPGPFAHWYVDGGHPADHDSALICVSYAALEPVRTSLLQKIQAETKRPGMGPEALRTLMAQMRPGDFGLGKNGDAVMNHFQLRLLTEGSGTQIFSTTFAQWTAREALRRAQPLTLLVRFAPRQRQRPMNELLGWSQAPAQLDPAGSLIDADFGAYYNWLNQQRLPGADQSSFIVWFENHSEAVAIGPAMPRGTTSSATATLAKLVSWVV